MSLCNRGLFYQFDLAMSESAVLLHWNINTLRIKTDPARDWTTHHPSILCKRWQFGVGRIRPPCHTLSNKCPQTSPDTLKIKVSPTTKSAKIRRTRWFSCSFLTKIFNATSASSTLRPSCYIRWLIIMRAQRLLNILCAFIFIKSWQRQFRVL